MKLKPGMVSVNFGSFSKFKNSVFNTSLRLRFFHQILTVVYTKCMYIFIRGGFKGSGAPPPKLTTDCMSERC